MSGKLRLAGVIGHPILHSKSPRLHGHWLKRYGIDGHYIPMDVAPDDLARTIELLPRLGFAGINVTLPHKEAVMALCDEITPRAKAVGAVNTVIFQEDGSVLGDNTDGYGFMANLYAGAPSWRADMGPAVVLGAGGAARGVVAALLDAGAPHIILSNRTVERATALQSEFGTRVVVSAWDDVGDAIKGANLLVNTTSLGMDGQPALPVSLDHLGSETLVTDIVYAPLKTQLLIDAAARGCAVVDGLGMLLHQAAPGFEAWFGQKPIVDDELRDAVLS
ncbi:shikimate dehydrogenase [Nereida ignava]|uniref:Shikimate dehydrogenase (NADP(+)) n=1 Tax=Nereida ignava TaxID=282199 RepID=A0A0U1NKA2_9RHOB|nr:shikimate dehydrogenase [Nereida ignava]CRK75161.1 Shikimate dehydrogenase [Nereida ignava]SFI99643.1 shikimate dehydrogenase [Nereida ignava DSM 16309]